MGTRCRMSYRAIVRPDPDALVAIILAHATLASAAASLGVAIKTLRRWRREADITVERRSVASMPVARAPWWRRVLRGRG